MEENKKKVKSVEIRILVNKEQVTMKLFFKLFLMALLMQLVIFNIGLLLVAVGLKIAMGYILVHSFAQWIGFNFLGFGLKWLYNVLFKHETKPTIDKDVQAKIKKEYEAIRDDAIKATEEKIENLKNEEK